MKKMILTVAAVLLGASLFAYDSGNISGLRAQKLCINSTEQDR